MFTLIKRERAPRYILLVVLSFAITILVTRLFLYVTGYPKIGNGVWHIGHVLWGGVLLSIGSFLILIFSNAKAYYVSSVLVGIGMGFFFDEIGKFITESNDYFFQAAAPIIYLVFLLIFFVYMYLRRPREISQRELFYQVLDDCKEILDEDLDPVEKEEIKGKLLAIARLKGNEDIRKFSKYLYHFVEQIEEDEQYRVSVFQKVFLQFKAFVRRQRKMHQGLFFVFLAMLLVRSVNSVVNLVFAWVYLLRVDRWYSLSVQKIVGDLVVRQPFELNLLIVQTFAEGVVGMVVLWAIWKRFKYRKGGLSLIRFALLFSILTIDVIAFYFEQFSHVLAILVDVVLIVFLDFYGRIYDEEKL
jgi:hypothetical protein